MAKSELYAELMQDTTQYCCYCGDAKHSFGCCGENHFETFAEMDGVRQQEFMAYEGYDE